MADHYSDERERTFRERFLDFIKGPNEEEDIPSSASRASRGERYGPRSGDSRMARLKVVAERLGLPPDRTPKRYPRDEAVALAAEAGVTLPGESLDSDIVFLEEYAFKQSGDPVREAAESATLEELVKACVPEGARSALHTDAQKMDAIARQLGRDVEADKGMVKAKRLEVYHSELFG